MISDALPCCWQAIGLDEGIMAHPDNHWHLSAVPISISIQSNLSGFVVQADKLGRVKTIFIPNSTLEYL